MASMISNLIKKVFGNASARGLIVGLDASGKTTVLYKLKLGEVVTTIPTIGFNVESIVWKGMELTMWDVGGCDKIRPLWRHYFENTQFMVVVVDSADIERMSSNDDDYSMLNTAEALMHSMLSDDELRDTIVLVLASKQDLPGALSPDEVAKRIKAHNIRQPYHIQGCCATSGDGLYEGLNWVHEMMVKKQSGVLNEQLKNTSISRPLSMASEAALSPPAPSSSKTPLEKQMDEWLTREDEDDDEFLRKLETYTLETWDHRTHLRIAWLVLQREGRPMGLQKICSLIRNFIENSPRTRGREGRGTTYHETMTFFWVHMVHYAMVATQLPSQDFKTFLLLNPQLANGGLFLQYYSKETMLMNPESRAHLVLPDKSPLPSYIGGMSPVQLSVAPKELAQIIKLPDLSNSRFFDHYRKRSLPAWGHAVKIRLIYCMLALFGRAKGGVDKMLQELCWVEREHYHCTINYFWIQMVTYAMALLQEQEGMPMLWRFGTLGSVDIASVDTSTLDVLLENVLSFETLIERCKSVDLLRSDLYRKFYSTKLIDSKEASEGFVLPDLQPLPNLL